MRLIEEEDPESVIDAEESKESTDPFGNTL
jgi:hypothetical protein